MYYKVESFDESDTLTKAGTLFYRLKGENRGFIPYAWDGTKFGLPSASEGFRFKMYDFFGEKVVDSVI